MPRNRRTARFYASEARIKDMQDAEQYVVDRRAEGLFADFRGGEPFMGLVISATEQSELLETENAKLREHWEKAYPHEEPPVHAFISNEAFGNHQLAREGETRMEALSNAHQAYLGSLATNPQVELG